MWKVLVCLPSSNAFPFYCLCWELEFLMLLQIHCFFFTSHFSFMYKKFIDLVS